MSEVYDDDLAAEEAILALVSATKANAEPSQLPPSLAAKSKLAARKGGRPLAADPIKLVAWRQAHRASIRETAQRWGVSEATVKSFCKKYGEAARHERARWECEQLDRELRDHECEIYQMFNRYLARCLSIAEMGWPARCEAAKGTSEEPAIIAARDAALAEVERDFREGWEMSMGSIPTLEPFYRKSG